MVPDLFLSILVGEPSPKEVGKRAPIAGGPSPISKEAAGRNLRPLELYPVSGGLPCPLPDSTPERLAEFLRFSAGKGTAPQSCAHLPEIQAGKQA